MRIDIPLRSLVNCGGFMHYIGNFYGSILTQSFIELEDRNMYLTYFLLSYLVCIAIDYTYYLIYDDMNLI